MTLSVICCHYVILCRLSDSDAAVHHTESIVPAQLDNLHVHSDCDLNSNISSTTSAPEDNMQRQSLLSSNTNIVGGCDSNCCKISIQLPDQFCSREVAQQTKKLCSGGTAKQSRCVQSQWFVKHPWLVLCKTRNKVFCHYCRYCVQSSFKQLGKKPEDAFTVTGFDNWKKATSRFREHELSQVHREYMTVCTELQKGTNLSAIVNDQVVKEQQNHRHMLLKQLSSIKYLMRQGLAFRGHSEVEGNLQQLLRLRSEDCDGLKEWLNKGNYLSPQIVNEQIKIFAHCLQRRLLEDIRKAGWFAILCDETTDISKKEQLCLAARWVDENYEIYEDPLAMIQVDKTDAKTLTDAIEDALIRFMLPLEKCRGQGFDGAANMSGHLSGVAARIKAKEPRALFVHCFGHCTNLALQDITKQCACIRDALDLAADISRLIMSSAQRYALFQKIKVDVSDTAHGLRPLCPTRWTVRTACIDAVIENYTALKLALQEISESASNREESSSKARGCLAVMDKFSTVFGLHLSYLIFSITEQLARTVQSQDILVQEACNAASATVSALKSNRNDEAFSKFFQRVCGVAKANGTDDPKLPRYGKIPARLDSGSQAHQFNTPDDFFRQQYFLVIDTAAGEIERRFIQRDMSLAGTLEKLLLKSANDNYDSDSNTELLDSVTSLFGSDIDARKLSAQLVMLNSFIKIELPEVKTISSIRTIASALQSGHHGKLLLSEVHTLLKLYFTIPVSTATAERTFSTLRRMKSYLRSTLSQERLNHTMMLHIHKHRTDEIDVVGVASEFIKGCDSARRLAYFGKF